MLDTIFTKFEKEFATHNRIEVSRSALLHNYDTFKRLSGLEVFPVLKGNAYGHGVEEVATALTGRAFPYIAVDSYLEALRVRRVSKQPVLVMGAIKLENFARLRYDNFAFVVQDTATIDALGKTGKRINIHLECNTGMNRYGARPREMVALAKHVSRYKNLTLEGIMSHLADSDGDDPETVARAVRLFDGIVEEILALGIKPRFIHIAQTAGSLKARSRYANAMRLGIGLYGINPFPTHNPTGKKLAELRPALQFISTITKTISLEKGENVSYNYTFVAPKAMKIGVLPAGYYEGVNRALSNVGNVTFEGHALPIVGRVCMNHTMISLENAGAKADDEIVIYSSDPSARNSIQQIAKEHGLFHYNLLTALGTEVRRVLVE